MERNLKTYASAVALLGSLGMLTAGEAAAVAVTGTCPDQKDYSESRQSVVLSAVAADTPDPGIYEYGFKVCNISGFPGEGQPEFRLRDWELPYDPLAGIFNITAPEGWNWSLENVGESRQETGWGIDGPGSATPTWLNPADPFYDPRYVGLTQVIHFYTCEGVSECYGPDFNSDAIAAGDERSGFGFRSPFGQTNSPYQASWVDVFPRSGDPDFPNLTGPGGPNSPGLIDPSAVPEPNGLALFALALGALLAGRGRRKKSDPA